jgi:hypothetical protein
MAGFLNLRNLGGFMLRPRETNLCGVACWRAELLCTLRGAALTPFLIASGRSLETELTGSKQTSKHFLIARFSRRLRQSTLLASTANPLAARSESAITTHFGKNRSAPYTRPSVRNAITTSPTAPTTKGRKPCLARARMLVRRPTPAKVSRKAQRERLAMLVS